MQGLGGISRAIRRLSSGWRCWRGLGVEILHAHWQAFGTPRAGGGVEDAGARRATLLAGARPAQSPMSERVAVTADQESITIVAIGASPAAVADIANIGIAHAVLERRAARQIESLGRRVGFVLHAIIGMKSGEMNRHLGS